MQGCSMWCIFCCLCQKFLAENFSMGQKMGFQPCYLCDLNALPFWSSCCYQPGKGRRDSLVKRWNMWHEKLELGTLCLCQNANKKQRHWRYLLPVQLLLSVVILLPLSLHTLLSLITLYQLCHILGLKVSLRNWCGSGWLLLLLPRVGWIRPPHSNNRSNSCCPATYCCCGYKEKWMVLSAHLPAKYAHSS